MIAARENISKREIESLTQIMLPKHSVERDIGNTFNFERKTDLVANTLDKPKKKQHNHMLATQA